MSENKARQPGTWIADDYDFLNQEWRSGEQEKALLKARKLESDGWERDGSEYVWAGMFVDKYGQTWKRKKLVPTKISEQ